MIIDNSPIAYSMHPFNAIPIKSWYSDPHDEELLHLIPILEKLAAAWSVPKVIKCIIEWIKKSKGSEEFKTP